MDRRTENGRVLLRFSAFFGFIVFFLIVSYLTGGLKTETGATYPLGSLMTLLCLFGGIFYACYHNGMKLKRLGQRLDKMSELVLRRQMRELDAIAAEVPCTFDQAVVVLQQMIDDGLLPDMFIAFNDRRLISSAEAIGAADSQPAEKIEAVCRSCGARSQIFRGQTEVCEYCGSLLEEVTER